MAGTKLAVIPEGKPETDSDMEALNPAPASVARVRGVDPPGPRLTLAAPVDKAKAGSTVRLRACVFVIPAPAVVMIRLDVPVVAVTDAESVKMLLPLPGAAMAAGAKLADTPAGNAEDEMAIAELNPVPTAVVKLMEAEAPRATIRLGLLSDNVNVGRMVSLKV